MHVVNCKLLWTSCVDVYCRKLKCAPESFCVFNFMYYAITLLVSAVLLAKIDWLCIVVCLLYIANFAIAQLCLKLDRAPGLPQWYLPLMLSKARGKVSDATSHLMVCLPLCCVLCLLVRPLLKFVSEGVSSKCTMSTTGVSWDVAQKRVSFWRTVHPLEHKRCMRLAWWYAEIYVHIIYIYIYGFWFGSNMLHHACILAHAATSLLHTNHLNQLILHCLYMHTPHFNWCHMHAYILLISMAATCPCFYGHYLISRGIMLRTFASTSKSFVLCSLFFVMLWQLLTW